VRGEEPSRRAVAIAAAAAAAVAVIAAVLGIGVRATQGGQVAVDEPQYLLTALSLFEDRSLDIADEIADRRAAAFTDAEPPVQAAELAGGRALSPHDPLLPLLLAGPVGLGGWVGAKLALTAVAGLTAVLTVWTAVRRLQVPAALAGAGVAVAAASAPLAVYGQQLYPELPAAAAALAAAAAGTGRLNRAALTTVVIAVVALPWFGVKYTPVAAALTTVVLVRLARGGRRTAAAGLLATLAAAGIAYLAAHQVVYGGWTVYAAGRFFATTGELSVVGVDPDYVGRSLRLVGLLVDRGFGLAAWQPAWLLVVPAVVALVVARPPGWAVLAAPLAAGWATATWAALTMHGFWWPGRQLVVVLPLAVLVVLWWLARLAAPVRLLAAALAACGVVTYAALLRAGYAGDLTWVVGFETVPDPAYQALRPWLPDYRAPSFLTAHLGWACGLVGLGVVGGWSVRRHALR
jgi:hypothetical protein